MNVSPEQLSILTYPHPALRRKAVEIDLTDEVRAVSLRMIDLMRQARGIGLAAPQVGLSWRLFVAEVFPDPDEAQEHAAAAADGRILATDGPAVYINPVISEPAGPVEGYDEGCLSLPEITGRVMRPPLVTITATDLEGRRFTQRGAGLLARCWQHELDHLDGVLILDKMDQMSRLKMRSAVRALEKRP